MTVRRVLRWFGALMACGFACVVAFIAILGWRQPDELALPAPTGPYAVGRIALDWRDDRRVDAFAPVPGTKRDLPIWIWYPAARDATQPRAPYLPPRLREAMQPNPPLLLRLLLDPLTTDRGNVASHSLDAAPLVESPRLLPLVLLKPAVGAAVVQNSVLAEDLASHGYVVIGSDSPHTTPGVAYQDGRVVLQTAAGHPSETAPGNTSDLAPGQPNGFYVPVVDAWVQDQRFILDRLQSLNERDPSNLFTGRLDPDHRG